MDVAHRSQVVGKGSITRYECPSKGLLLAAFKVSV